MPQYDLPLDQLRAYNPALRTPEDLQEFWTSTLAESQAQEVNVRLRPIETPYSTLQSFDVTFAGFGGDDISAWLHLPTHQDSLLPGIVEYGGYGAGRGLPHERVVFALAGYAHLVMDNRGMGAGGFVGSTPDNYPEAPGNHMPGFMTKGILSKHTCYLRRLYVDSVRAVDALRSLDDRVDPTRISVAGGSMGGGLSIVAAALSPGVRAALVDVPFLCHFERAIRLTDRAPYAEIAQYLGRQRGAREQVEDTLSYFDAANLAGFASAPAMFSVALMDAVCPPSTVYAAFNRYGGEKQLVEYEFNDHEGGQGYQHLISLDWLSIELNRDV